MSDGAGFVLDASALLAHLLAEPGGEVVRDTLAELSLADRACLALAQRLELPVMTTDRAWAQLQIGVEIRLARP